MFEWMDARGKAIPLDADHWWRKLARAIIAKDGRGYRLLGADLAKHVGRKVAFNHGMLSAFATGKLNARDGQPVSVTWEFAEAMCAEYAVLPPPVFLPRSMPEAVQLKKIHDGFADVPAVDANSGYIVPTSRRRGRRKPSSQTTSAQNADARHPASKPQRAAR